MPTQKGKAANGGLPFSWRFHVTNQELNVRAVGVLFRVRSGPYDDEVAR
jgi:hypothetical protein